MLVGQKLGPFVIEKELGSGAMGTVYRGRHEKSGQKVAIKVMSPAVSGSAQSLARFEREAAILKQLHHPNIVRYFGASKSGKVLFYAMEYLDGETLDVVLERGDRLTWEKVIALGQQICLALQHAHDQGIVHRDLKPSNLMILPDGTLKLTDFGIAKDLDVTQLTATNATVGTASYMSPEQCRGEKDLSHKSDLYSLGVMLYELVTGQKPFNAESTMDMFLAHTQGTFERPARLVLDLPVWLDNLICQLMEKDPDKRPFDASTVYHALGRVLEKHEAQRSAAADAVSGHPRDRLRSAGRPDEADRDAASALRGKRRRKRKEEKMPFFRQIWFQIAGILVVLAGLGLLLYSVFRPASPDKLYAQAKKLMETNNPDNWAKARKRERPEGPLTEYLRVYASRDDEQARQMRAWADQVDVYDKEQLLANLIAKQRKGFKLGREGGEAESAAFDAALAEDAGDLDKAAKLWQEVQSKFEKGEGSRDWALVAGIHLKQFAAVNQAPANFTLYLKDVHDKKPRTLPSEEESTAFRAWRFEKFGDLEGAFRVWEDLKQRAEKEAGQRVWFLLAAQKAHDLKPRRPANPDRSRLELLETRLKEANQIKAESSLRARAVGIDIVDLYGDDKDPDVQKQVAQAQQLLKEIAGVID